MLESIINLGGIIIAILGIFIGIIFFIITNFQRSLRDLKDEVKNFGQVIENMCEKPILFSADSFLTALSRETKFWEKLPIQRVDKFQISNKISTKYIQNGNTIILDSGTTIYHIPLMLRDLNKEVTIYTNNLLAAISIVPPDEDFKCFLLSGKIDHIYGATYNIGKIEDPIKHINANIIILAATLISFKEGPMVHALDHSNRLFKRELVRKSLEDTSNPTLIIAVDWMKFSPEHKDESIDKFNPVLDLAIWKTVLQKSRFALVLTEPPEGQKDSIVNKSHKEINLFKQNMKDGGMKVDVCSLL